MTLKDYYQILNIDEESDLKTIKIAFRKQIAIYHPDNNKSPDAAEKFELVIEAFNVLGNEEKRSKYDALRLQQKENNIPATVITSQEKANETWEEEAKKTSREYWSTPLEQLLLLDIFLTTDILGDLFTGTGDIIDSASDALDGLFDIF